MKKLYISNKDESVRMFKSGFLEFFTHVHWSVPIILYVPLVSYFSWQSVLAPEITFLIGIGLFIGGAISWTIAEYFIHRYVFHFEPNTTWGKRMHFIFHGVHHDYPNDSKRLVMPPGMSVPLAFLFFFIWKAVWGEVFMMPFFAGFVFGYIIYDTLHFAIHHWNFKGKWWNELKAHHLKHHFKEPEKGYGVSSPLWDKIVGTDFNKK